MVSIDTRQIIPRFCSIFFNVALSLCQSHISGFQTSGEGLRANCMKTAGFNTEFEHQRSDLARRHTPRIDSMLIAQVSFLLSSA